MVELTQEQIEDLKTIQLEINEVYKKINFIKTLFTSIVIDIVEKEEEIENYYLQQYELHKRDLDDLF